MPKLPQFSRLFSAPVIHRTLYLGGRIGLWGLLVALFYANVLVGSQTGTSSSLTIVRILEHPFNLQSHIQSALEFKNLGFTKSAAKELALAQDLIHTSKGSVLGATTNPESILNDWTTQPQRLRQEYLRWKGIIAEKPDYRDGLIITGILANELGNTNEAITYLKKAQQLDPNNTSLNTLLGKIEK